MANQNQSMTTNEAKQLGAKTLWIGDVEPWMDENYIAGLFQGIASVQQVKLIRDKIKGTPIGYGFVEFPNHDIAKNVYITLNGAQIPGTTRCFKLNWATHGSGGVKQPLWGPNAPNSNSQANSNPAFQQQQQQPNQQGLQPSGPQGDYQVYIGDLDPNVNNSMLLSHFQKKYPSVYEAKIIVDPVTRFSKGYGFLRFGAQEQAQASITEMQGQYLLTRPMRLNYAASRRQQNDNNMNQGSGNHRGGMNTRGGHGGDRMHGGGQHMNNYNSNPYGGYQGGMGPPAMNMQGQTGPQGMYQQQPQNDFYGQQAYQNAGYNQMPQQNQYQGGNPNPMMMPPNQGQNPYGGPPMNMPMMNYGANQGQFPPPPPPTSGYDQATGQYMQGGIPPPPGAFYGGYAAPQAYQPATGASQAQQLPNEQQNTQQVNQQSQLNQQVISSDQTQKAIPQDNVSIASDGNQTNLQNQRASTDDENNQQLQADQTPKQQLNQPTDNLQSNNIQSEQQPVVVNGDSQQDDQNQDVILVEQDQNQLQSNKQSHQKATSVENTDVQKGLTDEQILNSSTVTNSLNQEPTPIIDMTAKQPIMQPPHQQQPPYHMLNQVNPDMTTGQHGPPPVQHMAAPMNMIQQQQGPPPVLHGNPQMMPLAPTLQNTGPLMGGPSHLNPLSNQMMQQQQQLNPGSNNNNNNGLQNVNLQIKPIQSKKKPMVRFTEEEINEMNKQFLDDQQDLLSVLEVV